MKPSKRSDISPFMVMEAFREAAKIEEQGADVMHLSLGQPSARPPKAVLDAVAKAALEQPLGYTDARGMPELRQMIADHYKEQYGLNIDPARVFMTVGSSAAYFMALLSAFEVGDKIALVSPHYPASPNMMRALGIDPIVIRATMDDNYQPTLAMLKALPEKPDGLVIASPANPTGTVIDPVVFKEIIDYCEVDDIRIISDEIYHGVSYDNARTVSVLEHSDRMIVTNSFSKYYLLPGWRLGWCVMPEELMRNVESLLQNFFISPPSIAQYAAMEVLQHRDALDDVVKDCQANRDRLIDGLKEVGLERLAPADGAFYIYADISAISNDSAAFCKDMLEQAHVCAVPGIDFDREEGHRFVRFSYCGDFSAIDEACKRLKAWVLSS